MKQNEITRETVMYKSFFVNFFLIVAKLIGGFLFRSTALIADAMHSLSDLLSDILVIFGLKHSNKPPDQEHPFGHGKIEYVLSLFMGLMIFFIAYQLGRHTLLTFMDTPVIPSLFAAVVSLAVITVKFLLSRFIKGHAEEMDSQILHASADESFTDVLSSAAVIFGVSLTVIANHFDLGWLAYADRIAAIFIVLLIARMAFIVILSAIKSILGKSASKALIDKTKARIINIDGVISVDRLTMIAYGHYYQVMVDIRVDGLKTVQKGHDIASDVKQALKKDKKIGHVIVHVNPEV